MGNGRGDILATNLPARALYSPLYEDPTRPVNVARFRFLNPRTADFFRDWESTATETVAALRSEAGKSPYDRALTDLIGELSTRSEELRIRWAAHDVRLHRTGVKRLRHPVVGDLVTGKTVHPFTTHAMSGLGTTERDYAASCRGATLREGLAVRGEEVADAEPVVESWLRRIGMLTR